MPRPSPRASVTRGVAVGAVTGVGAVVAHAATGGGHVDLTLALTVLAFCLAAGPVLVRRARPVSLAILAGGAVLAQLVAHVAMALLSPGQMALSATRQAMAAAEHDGHVMVTAAHPGCEGHLMDASEAVAAGLMSPGTPGGSLGHALDMVLLGGLPMLAAHLAIAALTALLAHRADQAVLSLLTEWLLPLLPVLLTLVPRPELPAASTPLLTPTAVPSRTPAAPRGPPRRTTYLISLT